MPVGAAVLDDEWVIRYVNLAGAALLGRPATELVGHHLWTALPEAAGSIFHTFLLRARTAGTPVTWRGFYPPTATWLWASAEVADDLLHVYLHSDAAGHAASEVSTAVAGEDADRERLRYLAEVSESLITTLDTGESVKRLAELLVPRLADWAVVTTFGEGGRAEEAWAHRDPAARADVDTVMTGRRTRADHDEGLLAAIRAGSPVQVTDVDRTTLAASLPTEEVRAAFGRLNLRSYTLVPLRAHGETFGALVLMNDGSRPPHSEAEIATATEVARRGALALDNARLYGKQHVVAETLQLSLLTPPPHLDGLQVAVGYAPANSYQQVGGDWYDVFDLPDGATCLVIGDVVGHNVDAAATMGQIRGIMRGIACDHPGSAAQTLARVDRALTQLDVDTLATAVLAHLEPADDGAEGGSWTLRWSSAGHLPPAVLRADGTVRLLSAAPEQLLGLGVAGSRTTHETTLAVGDTVLLYTDGIVEHGRSDIDTGLDRLTHALEDLTDVPLEEFCSQLQARVAPEGTDDDIALLAVRCGPAPLAGVPADRRRRPARLRQWEAPSGLRHGDHVCWTFDGAAEFSAAVTAFLDEGRRRGDQLILAGDSETDLLDALAELPERDSMLADGRLQIRPSAGLYGGDRGLDPVGQVQAFRGELAAALGRGRSGLRVAADITDLARGGLESRRQLHVYERLCDTLIGSSAITGMCLYDAALGAEVLGPLTVLHPVQHHGDQQPLAHLSGRGDRLALHGEIADRLADDVFAALFDLACAAPGEVEVDLADLDFLDRVGARTLARTVRLLGEVGVQLRLVGPQPIVARVLHLEDLATTASMG